MFDRVFALYRPCAYPGVDRPPTCLWPDGSPKYAMVLRWSNHRARDHQKHVAPQRKPNPASQKSYLTKTLLWTCNFVCKLFLKSDSFSQNFVGRSVGISRICRVREFQNPTVHAYRSYRKESAYAVSKEAKEQAAARRERKRGADAD